MSATTYITKLTALDIPLLRKEQRVFRVFFECLACTDVGSEFEDEMLTVSHSWCPNCGRRCEPIGHEEFEETRYEFDLDDED